MYKVKLSSKLPLITVLHQFILVSYYHKCKTLLSFFANDYFFQLIVFMFGLSDNVGNLQPLNHESVNIMLYMPGFLIVFNLCVTELAVGRN